jgi:integrase-like protein
VPATLTPLVDPPAFYRSGEAENSPVRTHIDGLESPDSRRTMDQALGRVDSSTFRPAAGPPFCPVRWSGSIQRRHMTGKAIGEMLARRCTEAGIARILAHDFRETFISNFLAMGGDLVLAQKQAGHADVSTTARYDRRGDLLLQQAVEGFWFPLPGELQSLQPTSATDLVAHGKMTDHG